MANWKYLLSLIVCLFFFSCPYHRVLLQQSASLDTLKVSLRRMERDRKKEAAELKADIDIRLEKMEEEIRNLSAKVDDLLGREERTLRPRAEEPVPDTLFFSGEELYHQSHLDFTRGEYDLAIQGFRNYLQKFPNTELSDNAQYWIGECYYSKGEYDGAIEEFKKVEANYPAGNKVPAALYKIGLIYLKLGKKREGETYLRRVISSFPNSPEAKQAKEKLKS